MEASAAFPNFRQKAIEIIKLATIEDRKNNYEQALELYQSGIDHLLVAAKYEKLASTKQTLLNKAQECLTRAEQLREYTKSQEYITAKNSTNTTPPAKGTSTKSTSDDEFQAALSATILKESPRVLWSDIAGLEEAKSALKEAIILPVKAPHLFAEERLDPWKGVLLYGPPGTGKTQLARAVATQCKSTFFSVSSSDLVSKWVGESERLIRKLFDMARSEKPSVIFIDEIDSMCGSRKESDNDSSTRIKAEFLAQMDGVGKAMDGILVLGATNLPWALDTAILRRFERRIYIPLPDTRSRMSMIPILLKKTPHSLSDDQLVTLADATQNFSGSDLKVLVNDAKYEAARFLMKEATHIKRVFSS
eukprot:TRINITY_DN6357_c0_g1_i1.p1 TRINITY_DN6357_c0_g1~~TRINITY_DN6357_c0_g1_i1.p1  ORF type:complete len:363 (-),score=86.43 TRINITY_DN6357_c0_g1_i1:180-1268(-)